jgi:gluconate 5-dehydrogenase
MTDGDSMLHDLFSLQGKTALITGASGGIGGAMAVAYARAGATIGVHGRDHERVAATCQEIEKVGGQAVPLYADLTDVKACRDLIQEAHQKLGRLDILVNNAGTNRRKPIAEVTEDDYEFITATNARAVYFLSQSAHVIMKAQGSGKIIHIGSMNVHYALESVSVYGTTKGAVTQLTKVQAVEWAGDNIQVNCITPGYIRTPLSEPIWSDPKRSAWLLARLPIRRAGVPEDLIGAALLLAGAASDYITGQNIVVDGGFMAGGSWNNDPQ